MKRELLKQIIVLITVSLCLTYAASSVVLAESMAEEMELDDYADTDWSDDFYEGDYEEEDTVFLENEDEEDDDDEDTDLIESLDEEESSSIDSEPEVLEDEIFEDITDSTADEEAAFAASDEFTIENGVLKKYNGPGGDVVIPQGVTKIGNGAFNPANNLTSITIPDSVTSIGASAFYICNNLTSLTIPSSVKEIGQYGFGGCNKISSLVIPDGIKIIRESSFQNCFNITNLVIPDSVTEIQAWAFDGCNKLTSLTIPGSVKKIGECAFADCTSLTSLTIPDNVTSVGAGAFSGCNSLTSLTIPDSVTSVGDDAFYVNGGSNLTSISIGNGLTDAESIIGSCQNLRTITISPNMQCSGGQLPGLFEDTETHEVYDTIPNGVSRTMVLKRSILKVDMYDFLGNQIEELSPLKYFAVPLTQNVHFKFGSFRLEENVDYRLSYENNVDVGTAYLIIEGINSLTGRKRLPFEIKPREISFADFTEITSKVYTGSPITQSPKVTFNFQPLTLNTDYSISYSNNTNVGDNAVITFTGMGKRFTGTYSTTFSITPKSLVNAEITGLSDKIYTGSAFEPKPTVTLDGRKLVLDQDYYLKYKYNTDASASEAKRATVAVYGMGNYSKIAVARFWIKPASLAKAEITGIKSKVYTGQALTQSPVVKLGGKTLKLDTDYYLAYKNNINTGKATIAIKGKGNYNSVAVRYFAINPKPSWIASLSSPKTKQIKITWGKRTQISGYQLEISTNKDFSKPRMQKNVYDPANLSMTVKVAKAKTTYYVRIRSFKKTKEKTYFSAWSATKTIKTK